MLDGAGVEVGAPAAARRNVIIIVGAGEAGVAAAAAIRETDKLSQVMLISEEEEMPYSRPPLSKEVIVANAEPTPIRPAEWYAANDIELLTQTRVQTIEPARREAVLDHALGGARRTIVYDALLLTTGARARTIPAQNGIAYLRTAEDSRHIRETLQTAKSIAIIGGGVIGLELASSACKLGKKVTVVDVAERLMARAVPPDISHFLLGLHQSAGVRVILGAENIEVSANTLRIRQSGGENLEISADMIVAGIGVIPNDELARAAGCATDNGIIVNGLGQTNVPGLYAAGDVARFHHPVFERAIRVEAWKHAGRQGAHVGRAIVDAHAAHYSDVPWFWTDQHGLNIQVAGNTETIDRTVWRDAGQKRTAFHFFGDRLSAVTTIDNGRDIRAATRLIAAGWRGDPSDLIDPMQPLATIAKTMLELETVTVD